MDKKWDPEDLALRLENHKEYTPAANEIAMEEAARFIRKQQDLILGLEALVGSIEKRTRHNQSPNAFRESGSKLKRIYDFELCAEYEELESSLHSINHLGYDLIGATQDDRGVYTLFFRRPGSPIPSCS